MGQKEGKQTKYANETRGINKWMEKTSKINRTEKRRHDRTVRYVYIHNEGNKRSTKK